MESRAHRVEVESEGWKFLTWVMTANLHLAGSKSVKEEGLGNWTEPVIHSC